MKKSQEIQKTINSKSTKSEIQAAFQEAIKAIKSLEKNQFNPDEIKKEKENQEIISKVETNPDINIETINKSLSILVDTLNSTYEQSKGDIDGLKDQYNTLEDAIKIKKEELRELTGIEDVLVKFVNLKEHINKCEKAEQDQYNEKIEILKKGYEDAKSIHVDDIEKLKDQYSRLREQFEFDFKKEKRNAEYEWEQEHQIRVDNATKVINARFDEIKVEEKRINELNAKYADDFKELEELKNKVAEIPELIEKAEIGASEKAKEKAKKSYNYEKVILENKYKSDIALLENKVETLEDQYYNIQEENNKLVEKLEKAYGDIKAMASETITSKSSKDYINSLENLVKDQNKKEMK